MKKILLQGVAIVCLAVASTATHAQYVDLSTGQKVTLVKHQGNGMMFNTQTQRAVNIYVDPTTKDTFYGRTGENINGKVSRLSNGRYAYNNDQQYIYKNGEFTERTERDSAGYRRVFQKDGDVKVKYGDVKKKYDREGDVKMKKGEAKIKSEADGTFKAKNKDFKKKIDEDGNILVKDDSLKVKINNNGSRKIKVKEVNTKQK